MTPDPFLVRGLGLGTRLLVTWHWLAGWQSFPILISSSLPMALLPSHHCPGSETGGRGREGEGGGGRGREGEGEWEEVKEEK